MWNLFTIIAQQKRTFLYGHNKAKYTTRNKAVTTDSGFAEQARSEPVYYHNNTRGLLLLLLLLEKCRTFAMRPPEESAQNFPHYTNIAATEDEEACFCFLIPLRDR